MPLRVDVIIIGGGQAGLSLSHCLTAKGIEHVVLERGRVGERWIAERWPNLRLLSPNFMTRLPGLDTLSDPEAFMKSAEFAAMLGHYADSFGAPVLSGCHVWSVARAGEGFSVWTSSGDFRARAVVVATGACDQPAVPGWASLVPEDVRQVTTIHYKGPEALDAGGVLVVGASATGLQLASEIHASGRPVTIAAGRHARAPRRYRGKDIFHWLDSSGFLYEPRDPLVPNRRLFSMPSFQLIGSEDGHDIGLDRLEAEGVTVAGRALGTTSGRVWFAESLQEDISAAEARLNRLLSSIDQHIAGMGLDAPHSPEAWKPAGVAGNGPVEVSLGGAGVRTIVWATGFRRTYPWLKLPVIDPRGEIVQFCGVTPEPGLFTLGLPFMRQRSSAFIYGAARDSDAIAQRVGAYLARPNSIAA